MINRYNFVPVGVIITLLSIFLTSCQETPEAKELPTPIRILRLATVAECDSHTLLEIWHPGENREITLSTPQILSGVRPGERISVYYEAEVTDTLLRPVPIRILSAGAVAGGEILTEMPEGAAPLRYSILSTWSTGRWLNFQMKVKSTPATTFTLVADPSTLQADTIVCRFVGRDLPDDNSYIDRRLYASFDTSSIISRPGQTVRIEQ